VIYVNFPAPTVSVQHLALIAQVDTICIRLNVCLPALPCITKWFQISAVSAAFLPARLVLIKLAVFLVQLGTWTTSLALWTATQLHI